MSDISELVAAEVKRMVRAQDAELERWLRECASALGMTLEELAEQYELIEQHGPIEQPSEGRLTTNTTYRLEKRGQK